MSETIYISRRCEHCHELLVKLHKNREILRFPVVDIDTNPYPNIIQSVPCMVVDGQVLPGVELFKFIDYLLKQNSNEPDNEFVNRNDNSQTNQRPHPQQGQQQHQQGQQQQQQQQQQHQQQQQQGQQQGQGGPPNDNNEDDELDGFCIGGMCDLGFSMLEETSNGNINQDNYEYLNTDMKHTEKVIEESTKSGKAQEMDDEYARMMEMRGESMGGNQMGGRV
jgi:hypothetical protein